MRKGKIITISIISFFVLLNVILFGFVFRLRQQTVRFVGDVSVSEQAIIDVAGLKTGGSIFMLDKQTASQKIEKDFPYLKVIEISTKSVTKIEFVIRSRYEMFYIESNGWNYILDEDLKVLDKRESLTEAQLDLICLDLPLAEQDNINKSDILGSEYDRNVIYNFFVGIYTTVKVDNEYINRAGIRAQVVSINYTTQQSKTEQYTRLVIKLKDGATIDIAKPDEDLIQKINYCFAVYQSLDEEAKSNANIPFNLDTDISVGRYY